MIRHLKIALTGAVFLLALPFSPSCAPEASAAITAGLQRVSAGSQGSGGGAYVSISADGRYVVFESYAADLVDGHLRDSWDVFLRDRTNNDIQRVSTRSDGSPVYNPGDYTSPPSVSADGRYVAFMSRSEGLVSEDGNGLPDIFLHDRQTENTSLVSARPDGRAGNGQSFTPAISPDGRYVAFQSTANDLVAGDDNDAMDIFIRDLQTGVTELVSVAGQGEQGFDHNEYGFSSLSVSPGGRYVAFSYDHLPVQNAPPAFLPSVYLRDRQAGQTTAVAVGEYPRLSGDGRYLVFVSPDQLTAGDVNVHSDAYLYDLQTGSPERVSLPAARASPNDLAFSGAPDVSAGGRFVAFVAAGELVPGAPADSFQVYLRDRAAGITTLVTSGYDGSPADGDAHEVAISADGRTLSFTSSAGNLVPGDNNGASDVFAASLLAETVLPDLVGHVYFFPVVSR